MANLSKEIEAYALKNALEFGSSDPRKILPKLFQHGLEKKDIPKISKEIGKISDKINALAKDAQEKLFSSLKHLVKEREEKKKTLPKLEKVTGKVITRISPEPSKHLHIGHALSFLVNAHYAEEHNGSCLLRFDDANPEKVSKEYIDSILEDITSYLKIKPAKIVYISEEIPKFYKYAEQLIKLKEAYVCFCDREKMQSLRHEGKACSCRSAKVEKNKKEWASMIAGKYSPGSAILRFKGDMKSKNQVMRDPALFRINNFKHYKQDEKYKVWPLYDFYTPIEDSLMGITHILRTSEFDLRVELHQKIQEILGLDKQTPVQYGRISVTGAGSDSKSATKGREIRSMIESGEYSGWDDPRLVTLKALKRRGITIEALKELSQQIGLSRKEVKIDFAAIAAISRKLHDETAQRFYFIKDPKQLEIAQFPSIKEILVKINPNSTKTRSMEASKNTSISMEDYGRYRKQEIRLMSLCNVLLAIKPRCTGTENKNVQKVQWVDTNSGIKIKILMDDAKWIFGLAEANIKKIKVGEVVQFERFGFVRLDKKPSSPSSPEKYEFWFSHK